MFLSTVVHGKKALIQNRFHEGKKDKKLQIDLGELNLSRPISTHKSFGQGMMFGKAHSDAKA